MLKLGLDWTPNVNHIGFFVAQAKGFYKDHKLKVAISNPLDDDYTVTPAKKIELGLLDFALCPMESIISFRTKEKPFPLTAIACLLQDDLSAIAVRSDMGINSPKDLDGKTYASYKARYEDGIVKAMVENDGGNGNLNIIYPEKLGIWNTVMEGECDATWIFLNWEGVAAKDSPIPLKYFKMADFQIPYSYSPVIAANADKMAENLDAYQNFLSATKKGFLYAQEHPAESIEILRPHVPVYDEHIDLMDALEMTIPFFGSSKDWGRIKPANITTFLHWLNEKGLEKQPIRPEDIATQNCFEENE
ncbi:MAG: ABC transporter substrate-binding protein [Bacteroidota bacterium]